MKDDCRARESAQLEQLPDHPRDPEELVLLPLLQSHQRPGRLLRVLRVGEDAPHPLLRLHVSRFLEESHQRVLVHVLEDVGHGLLAVRRVELVAVGRGADPAGLGGHVGRHRDSGFAPGASRLRTWRSNSDDAELLGALLLEPERL